MSEESKTDPTKNEAFSGSHAPSVSDEVLEEVHRLSKLESVEIRIKRLETAIVETYRLFTRIAPHDQDSPYWQDMKDIVKQLTKDVPRPTGV